MNHTKIIELWESPQTLADEIGQKYNTVMQWKSRNSIPVQYWNDLIKSTQEHDLPVTFKLLATTIKEY